MQNCIEVIADAFIALQQGRVHLPLRMTVRPPDAKGLLGLMPAYQSGDRAAFGIKLIGVFNGNPALGKDSHQGAVVLLSGETGEPLAAMNASAITAMQSCIGSKRSISD